MSEGELVFVYGTLRRGGSNSFRMEVGDYIGPASVSGKLYQISWYPALVLDEAASSVRGDLWRIPSEALASLDDYEGGEYRRIKARVSHLEEERNVAAWIWVWNEPETLDESKLVECGDWLRIRD